MLRDYQVKAIEQIRSEFMKGNKKVLLHLATGSGKTTVFCKMVADAVARGKKAVIIVRGRKLVDQASKRLFREGVDHGVLMANHYAYSPMKKTQVCSIDTLRARNITLDADLIILDEAHLFASEGDRLYLSQYSYSFIVSVTATPYLQGGLRHIADKIVHPISMKELIATGYLVPFKYYAPSAPDLSNVEISSSTKDYVSSQLGEVMSKSSLVGDVVSHWKKLAQDKPTICFAVNVAHSNLLVGRFKSAGIAAEHIDANSSDSERNAAIRRLESGETKVICNVGILGIGVDIPCLGAIVMARPTKSKNLYIQQSGRVTRPFADKFFGLLLDHAGNIARHGFPTDDFDVDIDGKIKKQSASKVKICKQCFCVHEEKICPECGFVSPVAASTFSIEETDGELTEILEKEIDYVRLAYNKLLKEAKTKGMKSAWAAYKLIERFGFDRAKKYIPKWLADKHAQSISDLFRKSPFQGTGK